MVAACEAPAAHNAVLYQVMTGLERLLETSISQSLAKFYRLPGIPAELDARHRRIVQAISLGQADQARITASEHLLFVAARLDGIEAEAARHKRMTQALRQIRTMKETVS